MTGWAIHMTEVRTVRVLLLLCTLNQRSISYITKLEGGNETSPCHVRGYPESKS